MTVRGSTFANNSGTGAGAGINNFGTLSVTNGTFTGNTGVGAGGGVENTSGGTLTVTNGTFVGNSAISAGGGIDNSSSNPVRLTNTLVASSTHGDLGGGSFTGNNNLIGDGSGGLTGSGNLTGNPLLGVLGNYGGTTQSIPLLPGSPAIDAGAAIGSGPTGPPANTVPATDQRGKPRVGGVPDIGAFESQGFTLAKTGGDGQSTAVNTAFANPLILTLAANNAGEPVVGGQATFTVVPNAGAQATFGTLAGCTLSSGNLVATCPVDGTGKATSPTFTANTHPGGFTVTAAASGAPGVTFALTNLPGPATTLTVAGYPPSVVSGTVHSFTVTALDQFGNTATGYTGTVHFSTADTHATLPANAAFAAGDAGVRTFSATFSTAGTWSLTATDTTTSSITGTQAGIVVTPAPLVSIAVTPANATLKVGQQQQFVATGTYADNSTADLTTQVTWSSDAGTVATMSTTGMGMGQAPGTAHVTAKQGGVSGQATVTVNGGASVGIAPAPAPASRPGSATTTEPTASPVLAPTGR